MINQNLFVVVVFKKRCVPSKDLLFPHPPPPKKKIQPLDVPSNKKVSGHTDLVANSKDRFFLDKLNEKKDNNQCLLDTPAG